jgi:hypothetical protein
MTFFTQITMEAAEDPAFLSAMRDAHIKGALVGVEAVTEEGLKSIFKDFNLSGDNLAVRLRTFRQHGVHVLGSFIFGLPTDRMETFRATSELALKADITFAQFVTMTPYPGTVDFQRWEKDQGEAMPKVDGVPLNRYWLIPNARRPKLYFSHPALTAGEIASGTQSVWDDFYSNAAIWKRANCVKSLKARVAFFLIRSSIARCTPTRASRQTARAARARTVGRGSSPKPWLSCFTASRCRNCRFRVASSWKFCRRCG